MSFRNKLLSNFLTLLALVLGASFWTANRVETRSAESEVLAGLQTTSHVFEEILAGEGRQLATNLRLLSGDFALKAAVATGDPRTILSAAVNHRARIGADVLLFTDASGRILADTRRKAKVGAPVALSVVQEALSEKPAVRVHVLDGVPYELAAAAINAPDPIGAVVAGFKIDDRLAGSIKRLTRTDVAFATQGRVFASTLPRPAQEQLEAALGGLAPEVAKITSIGGERHVVLPHRLSSEVTVFIMRSWDKALEPSAELRRLLLAIAAAGLAVTVLLGFFIASGITASLIQLVNATHALAERRYDISLDVSSQDEIAELCRAFKDMAKGLEEREKIRSVLQKSVSKEIAEALLAQGKIELGGEEKTVTVLFSDFRSFTGISEQLSPRDLVAQLNSYLGGMARAIENHHGVVDKFVGDAVMALFGAPLSSSADAANAVRAAIAMTQAVDAISAKRRQAGLPTWRNGIGISTGKVIAGTMGSEDRWSYTVIGDAVNVASRVEGLTKSYGARILVSDFTRQAAGPGFRYRPIERVAVRGRKEPVDIFEVLIAEETPGWLGDFTAGLEAYRSRRWKEAKALFLKVLESAPKDGPSLVYLERIDAELAGKTAV